MTKKPSGVANPPRRNEKKMMYRIEYETQTKIEKMVGIEDDYVCNTTELKNIIKNSEHCIKCITKLYKDGAGVDVTKRYIS